MDELQELIDNLDLLILISRRCFCLLLTASNQNGARNLRSRIVNLLRRRSGGRNVCPYFKIDKLNSRNVTIKASSTNINSYS